MKEIVKMLQLILFEVGSCQIALHLESVIEIIRSVQITLLPSLTGPFSGVINYRGTIIPVLPMAGLMGVEARVPFLHQHMILVASSTGAGEPVLCLLVDQVLQFEIADEIKPVEAFGNNSLRSALTPELAKLKHKLVPIASFDTLLGQGSPQ